MKKYVLFLAFSICLINPAIAGVIDMYNGVKIGKNLPENNLQYLSPTPNTVNRLVLIDFWATWCEPCRKSTLELNALHKKYAQKGLVIIGVSQESAEEVQPFLAKFPMQYPHAVEDSMSLHKSLCIKALPYAIIVDKSNKIIWRGQPSKINEALIVSLLSK